MDVTVKYKDKNESKTYIGVWELQDNKDDYFIVDLSHRKKPIHKEDIEYIMIKK